MNGSELMCNGELTLHRGATLKWGVLDPGWPDGRESDGQALLHPVEGRAQHRGTGIVPMDLENCPGPLQQEI